jgi:hypothetical protein
VAAARKVAAAVRRANATSAEAAAPILRRHIVLERCTPTSREYEWIDMPDVVEFERDDQGLQVIKALDGSGRSFGLIYRRGAC